MSAIAPEHNPPFIAFQHCDSRTYILCFDRVLQVCPLCSSSLCDSSVELLAPPVRLPSLFGNAGSKRFSLAIKPTHGTFLQSYVPGSFLHVGITDSKGVVYSFDERGVNQESSGWEQSIIVPLDIGCHDYEMLQEWDASLHQFTSADGWTPQQYDEEAHNCFDFVVGFLNHVQYNQTVKGVPRPITREELCREYIVTMTTKAERRIELYRTIRKTGYAIQNEL